MQVLGSLNLSAHLTNSVQSPTLGADWQSKQIAAILSDAKRAYDDRQYIRAQSLYQVALNHWVVSLRPENLTLSDLTASLAEVEFLCGNYGRAVTLLKWSMKIDARCLGESNERYSQKVHQLRGLQMACRHRSTLKDNSGFRRKWEEQQITRTLGERFVAPTLTRLNDVRPEHPD